MGLILDSSVVIAAERRGDNVTQMLKQIVAATGDQRTVLSSVGLTELVHGIYRAQTAEARSRRDSFIRELLNDVEVYPYTKETALLAGKIDGEQQSRGIIIPFGDLLIGATALEVGYSVLTANVRHFRLIPGSLSCNSEHAGGRRIRIERTRGRKATEGSFCRVERGKAHDV